MINKPPLSTELPIPLPAPGEGKRGEAGHLGYLLRQAAAAQRLRMERALADLPITAPSLPCSPCWMPTPAAPTPSSPASPCSPPRR
ncbi:hypothetical protein ACSZN2_15115 [Aeromonas hydrophila]|uniref:hypothetical protein n=1 Tax=Aeromonas hydrophila TaxID=644 RepID=UPI003EC4DC2D